MPLDLAALLVEARAVSAEDMQRALQRQRDVGGALDTAILELGIVAEPELIRFLSRVAELPVAQVAAGECDPRASRVFPAGIAQRYRLAPFQLRGRELSLVSAHPIDQAGLADLGVMLSMQLVPYVAPEWRVLELLQALYGIPMPSRVAQIAARLRGASAVPGRTAAAATPERPGTGRAAPSVEAADPARAATNGTPARASLAPAWRLGRADPEEPLATAVAHAAETLDATEVLRDVIDPDPVPDAPPRWTLAEASAALATARDPDEVVAVALRYARDFLEAAVVFAVSREAIAGIDAVGWPRARQLCRSVCLRDAGVGLFRSVLETRGPYLGPMVREVTNQQLLRALGREWPAVILAYPVVVRDRVACVLYGDNGDAPVSPRRIGDLLLFAGGLGSALERVLRDTKVSQRSPFPDAADEGGWHLQEPARTPDAPAEVAAAARDPGEPFRVVAVCDAVQDARPPAGEEIP